MVSIISKPKPLHPCYMQVNISEMKEESYKQVKKLGDLQKLVGLFLFSTKKFFYYELIINLQW